VHDIEDLVKYGKKARACPFYMSRDIFASAELVFCPYNYIVDPAIRSSMQIDLTGAVVIFDEAHVRPSAEMYHFCPNPL
jgi:fanconi anemia group J protein